MNVGTTSASFDFSVSNTGDATVTITSLTHSNPSAGFSASIASTTLPPGTSTVLHTSYSPSGSGPHSDTVTISSDAGNASALLQGIANNPPVFNPALASDYFACASVAFSLTASATDPEGDAVSWSISSVPALPPPPAGAAFNSSTGTLNWTPNCSDAGNYSVTITITDGVASTLGSFTLRVTCLQGTTTSVTNNLNLNSNSPLGITFQPAGSWNVASWDLIPANTKLTATGYAGYATPASVSISGTTGTASFSVSSIASLLSGFSSNAWVTISMELELHLKNVVGCDIVRIPVSVRVKKP